MTALKLSQFGGELPAWDAKLLPMGQSQKSVNAYLFSGALTGWREPTALRNLTNPSAAFVYRIPPTTLSSGGVPQFNTSILAPSTWLEFTDPDTNVVRSQVVNDQFQRYYVASPSLGPPLYNTLNRIQNNANFFKLGIPAPASAPLVGVTGGGDLATLGPSTAPGGSATVLANTIYLIPIVPTGACQVNSLTFGSLTSNPLCEFFAVIYQDVAIGGNQATSPGAILASTAVTTGLNNTTNTCAFSNPIALNPNTPYWIGICLNTTETLALGDSFNSSASFAAAFVNGPPVFAPPANQVTFGQPDLQMYVNVITLSVLESRSYVYTYVSAYGEEGPPSPPTLLTGWSNGTWSVQPTGPPANYFGNSGVGNIAFIRIYRTVVSSAGAATFFLVADISVGSTDADAIAAVAADPTPCLPPASVYTDILPDNTVALNTQLPSTNYFPPPANLQGITVLPNGMYVGFVGTQVWFSVPYLPHAWPPGFVFTVDFPIVGLGVTAGALVAVTSAQPYVFNGTNPASMSQVRCAPSEPCLSRGSIVSTDLGVFYVSLNGLIQVTSAGACGNATELWITREKWDALVPLKYFRAVPFLGTYFGFGSVSPPSVSPVDTSVAQIGAYLEMNTDAASFTIWPQPGGHRIGFNEMQAPNGFNVSNVQLDPWTGICMLIQNGQVFYYDFTNPAPAMQPFDWTSKVFQQNAKTSFAAFKVFFTVPPGVQSNPGQGAPAQRNTALATDPSWQTLGPTAWAYVLFYADVDDGAGDGSMQLICAREVQRSGEVLRIPDGFKAENWQVRILARVNIANIQVATSVRELGTI